jgi:hypothetical protein
VQIADSHSCGVSTVLGATSPRGLIYLSTDRATGSTTVARAEAIHHHPATATTDADDRPLRLPSESCGRRGGRFYMTG